MFDYSGNNNYGFTISDYMVNFDEKTNIPKTIKKTDKILTKKSNGAF